MFVLGQDYRGMIGGENRYLLEAMAKLINSIAFIRILKRLKPKTDRKIMGDSCIDCRSQKTQTCQSCNKLSCENGVIFDTNGCNCFDCHRQFLGIIQATQTASLLKEFGAEQNYGILPLLCFNPSSNKLAATYVQVTQKPQHPPLDDLQQYGLQVNSNAITWQEAINWGCLPNDVKRQRYEHLTRGHTWRTAVNSWSLDFAGSPIVNYLGDNIFLGGTLADQEQVNSFIEIMKHYLPVWYSTCKGKEYSHLSYNPMIEVAIVEDFHFGLLPTKSISSLHCGHRYYKGTRVPGIYPTTTNCLNFFTEHIVQADDDLDFDVSSILLAAYNVLLCLSQSSRIWIHCKSGMGRSFMFALLIKVLLAQRVRPVVGSYSLALLIIKLSRCIKTKRAIVQNDPQRLVRVLDLAHAFFKVFCRIPNKSDLPLAALDYEKRTCSYSL